MKSLYRFDGGEDPHVDLTPLIDVIFMLVIFFILTMSFAQPVLEVALPQSSHSQRPAQHTQFIEVSLDAQGRLFHEKQQISTEELTALLRADPELELNIKADRNTPFQAFVTVADIAKNERAGRFAISTQPQDTP